MQKRVAGVVESILMERPGAQEILVRVSRAGISETRNSGEETFQLRRSLNIIALNPSLVVGERVLLNTTAVELGLGTGGLDFVICSIDRPGVTAEAPGHIMKLRYTPMQMPVLAVEAPESPYHGAMQQFESLDECPVVCAELHSQLPAICSAVHWGLKESGWSREPRIVYVMTEGAALPLALSRIVPEMQERGLIQNTVTAGQAFGGDYEAVNLYSALAASRAVCNADIIVAAQGPGNVGTQTSLGFSGIEQGVAVNAAGSLGGIPILAPRISFSDPRERHQAVSDHTLTVLRRVALVPTLIALPNLPREQLRTLRATFEDGELESIHQTIVVSSDRALDAYKRLEMGVTTMGRGVDEDRVFFLAACAAGLLAAQVVEAGMD